MKNKKVKSFFINNETNWIFGHLSRVSRKPSGQNCGLSLSAERQTGFQQCDGLVTRDAVFNVSDEEKNVQGFRLLNKFTKCMISKI